MPINISTDIAVTTGGKLTDITAIQGGWQSVDTIADMNAFTGSATLKGKLTDGQIFYVNDTDELYQLEIAGSFPFNTYTFTSFSWPGSGGGSATNLGDLSDVVTSSLDDGDVLAWNDSNSRWEPTNVSGTGDIGGVIAGDGLSGGGTQGTVSLDVDPGLGIELTSAGVQLDTGSVHFTNALAGIHSAGIFKATGSVFSTNNDLEITGSLAIDWSGAGSAFSVTSGSLEMFKVKGDGVVQFVTMSATPDPVVGGLYFDDNSDLYIGQ